MNFLSFHILQGRTFGSIIKNFLQLSGPLNEAYLPLYNTTEGRKYDSNLHFLNNLLKTLRCILYTFFIDYANDSLMHAYVFYIAQNAC